MTAEVAAQSDPRMAIALIGAAAGLIGGIITQAIAHWLAQRKVNLESELARQKKIVEIQDEILKKLTTSFYNIHISISKVTYCAGNSVDAFKLAYADYGEKIWQHFLVLRTNMSLLRAYSNEDTYKLVRGVYLALENLESDMTREFELGDFSKVKEHHRIFHDRLPEVADYILPRIARAMQLSSVGPELDRPNAPLVPEDYKFWIQAIKTASVPAATTPPLRP